MSERKGSSSEKTYRSRNRAIAALVQSSKNIVITDLSLDSAGVINLIDSSYVSNRTDAGVDSAGVNTLIGTAADSDRNAGTSTRVFRMSSASELTTLSQHNGLGTEIGQVRVGDIAYIAGGAYRGDVWVLTNITGTGSGYSDTGFRVQQNNGTVTRAWFDQVPAGQLPSENFAIGMTVARAAGGQDERTITAVSDTGAQFGGAPNLGYIDFTPSMAGYPPPFDNKNMYTNPAPLTTWHKLTFDSAEITNIIDSAYVQLRQSGSGGLDSALTTQLIDSAYVQLRQSGGAITVQEEGSSLSTSATTLNFVGSGVTATGSGATKTITVSGGGGGGLDSATTLALVNSQAQQTTFTYTTASPTTTISGNDDNGTALSYNAGNIIVFQNGILLVDSVDYTATGGSSITLGVSTDSGDIISVTKFTAGSGTGHSQFKYVTATPQTTFSGTATHGGTLSYDVGNIQVFLNGILLVDSQDYTATNGTSVVLTQATDSGDVVAISKFSGGGTSGGGGSGEVFRSTHFVYTTASPTTTITGNDDNSATLSYIADQVQVFRNGILLIDSADYTATNGTSIVLGAATDSGDTVVITAFRGQGSTAIDSADVIAIAGNIKSNMFRTNPQSLSINTTIDSNENAHCAGPISFDSGVTLTINGNLVIS